MSGETRNALAVIENRDGIAALLPPLRRQILSRLHDEPDSATGLSRKIGLARQKVNYHVRALERAGLLELEGERQRRGCTERRFRPTARAYLVNPVVLGELVGNPGELQDRFSSAYLITLAASVVRDVAHLRRGADKAGKRLPTLALQVDVRFRSPGRRAEFAEELAESVARLVERYQDDSPQSREYRFVIGGHPVVRNPVKRGDSRDGDIKD